MKPDVVSTLRSQTVQLDISQHSEQRHGLCTRYEPVSNRLVQPYQGRFRIAFGRVKIFMFVTFVAKAAYVTVQESIMPSPRVNSSVAGNACTLAVVMYGLPRSLRYTLSSIKKNIFADLYGTGCDIKLFLHTYRHSEVYHNRRSGEGSIILDNSEFQLLQPDNFIVDDVVSVLKKQAAVMNNLTTYRDLWEDNYESVQRALLALHSLKYATQLVASLPVPPAGMLILRPDLRYHDALNVSLLQYAIKTNSIVIPNWQPWGGANDRFAYGAYKPMMQVGGRYDSILAFTAQNQGFHTEQFLEWIIRTKVQQTGRCAILCTGQQASRVRADGKVKSEDFTPKYRKCDSPDDD